MKIDEKMSIFKKLSRIEKIEVLDNDLKIFENSDNVLHDIYILVSRKPDFLTEELLDEIYIILLNLTGSIKNKNLGEGIKKMEYLQEKILKVKQREEKEKYKDLEESENLLKEL